MAGLPSITDRGLVTVYTPVFVTHTWMGKTRACPGPHQTSAWLKLRTLSMFLPWQGLPLLHPAPFAQFHCHLRTLNSVRASSFPPGFTEIHE